MNQPSTAEWMVERNGKLDPKIRETWPGVASLGATAVTTTTISPAEPALPAPASRGSLSKGTAENPRTLVLGFCLRD